MSGTFQAGSITGRMELDRSGATASLKGIVSETTESMKKVEQTMNHASEAGESGYKKMLHGIKGELGRRSAFGETFELLAGGGVAMGASIAGEQIKKMTEGLLEMKKAAAEGGMNWADMTVKVMESLPVAGAFAQAGANIREIFTGEKAAIAETAGELKRYDDDLSFHNRMARELKESNLEAEESFRRLRQEMGLIGKAGRERDIQSINDELTNRIAEFDKKSGINTLSKSEQDDYTKLAHDLQKMESEKPGVDSEEAILAQMMRKSHPKGDVKFEDLSDLQKQYMLGAAKDEHEKQDEALTRWKKGVGKTPGYDETKSQYDAYQKRIDDASQKASGQSNDARANAAAKIADLGMSDVMDEMQEKVDRANASGKRIFEGLKEAKDQVHMLGMSPEQIELYQFKKDNPGATAAEIKELSESLKAVHDFNTHAMFKDLQGQLDTSKMDQWHKQMYDLAHSDPFKGDPVGLRKADALLESMAKHAGDMKLDDQAKAFRESIETAAEHFARVVKDLEALRRAGKITEDEFDKGVVKAHGEAYGPPKSPGFIRADSAEEYHLRVQGQRQERGVQDAQREAVTVLKSIDSHLREIQAGTANEQIDQPGMPSVVDTGVNV